MANKFNISQLLSNTSREESGGEKKEVSRQKTFKVVLINVHDLIPSKDNFYSVENVEELKTSIEMFGIKQNLVVKPIGNGKYRVIAGHRRRLATLELVKEGKKEFELIPCVIEESKDEIVERLLLITTNSTTRQLSDWEKIEQAREIKVLLEEYKKNEKLPGRIRDIIAETLNTSPTQVGRMDAISNNLTSEFKEELKEEKINMSTAYELSGLTEEKQIEAFKEYEEKGSFSIKDVRQKKEEETKVIEDVGNGKEDLDKLNNKVTEKLTKEYKDLSEKYEKVSGKSVDWIEGEVETVILKNKPPSIARNIKKLIELEGLDAAIDVIDVMLTQEIETIEELNDCIREEISYCIENM